MRLPLKERIALAAIADVAINQGAAPVNLVAVGARQKVSISYLEKLFKKMLQHRLIRSQRGPLGGYRLARDATRITVAEIFRAVDVPIDAIYGNGRKSGRGEFDAATRPLWSGLNAFLLDYLAGVTLDQVIEGGYAKPVGAAARRDIRSRMPAPAAALRWSGDEPGSLPR